MDPFEEFEFKPLTEGLGFHKKAEKLKRDIKLSNISEEKVGRSVPDRPPADMLRSRAAGASAQSEPADASAKNRPSHSRSLGSLSFDGDDDGDELDLAASRPASKSISDLMAALPPSLDILENESSATRERPRSGGESQGFDDFPFLSNTRSVTSQGTPAAVSSDMGLEPVSRPQIFQPLGREEYTAPVEKAPLKTAPIPGTPATLSSTAGFTQNSSSARMNLPPAPTFKSTIMSPAVSSSTASSASSGITRGEDKNASTATATALETPVAAGLQRVSSDVVAVILDALTVLGLSAIFLVSILMITKVNLGSLLSNARTDLVTRVHLVLLFMSVMQIYMLSARIFFGASLGEWAFDLQLGTDEEQKKFSYPFKVIWRTILVLITGIVFVPMLSKIIGRDLFALLGGAQLYRRT